MKILVDVSHPAHVHQFKNFIWNLQKNGHEIKITARKKDVILDLLNSYNLDFKYVGQTRHGLFSKALEALKVEKNIYHVSKAFNPDILIGGSGNFYIPHVSRLLGKKSIIFEDSEPDSSIYLLIEPFVSTLCTPIGFNTKLNPRKHIRYNGFKELAYLHPKYFKPDASVLDDLGIKNNEKFTLFRFVAWRAGHDIGHKGLSMDCKLKFIDKMLEYGKVFITSESTLPHKLEKYRITIPAHRIHDALFYAQLFISDSQTMTTEAGILGTPAIRSNSFVGTMSNFEELENSYGLIYSFKNPAQAFQKALELIREKDLKEIWESKRRKLLDEKIDVTDFMVNLVENYPHSY